MAASPSRLAQLYRYRLPVDSGLILNGKRVHQRQGLIIALCEAGRQGLGEVAPLSGFSLESLPQAESDAEKLLRQWQYCGQLSIDDYCPSVRCGFSFAHAELNSSLPTAGNYSSAFLSSLSSADKVDCGIVKAKLGRRKVADELAMLIRHMTSRPGCRYRLDVNQAWTLAQGKDFLSSMPPELMAQIDFIEEPCRDHQDSLLLAQQYRVPLAWDETLRQQPEIGFSQCDHVVAWVIKPMLLGSIAQCCERIVQASALGVEAIISSSLETSLGLGQLARLAAQLTPETLPGLDTLSIYQHQLIRCWPGATLPVRSLAELEEVALG
ncbi:o-succinylbenzoate synthase [Sinobacterium norvegicum]|uniref:o-succinylbenzoate synthase n=1 Tax=Sinobacterium norvegicum TaxID=1641715 RepID=A0ABN8ELD8_9GAMM|nr:o-succinylbenzoate synthase [Sinobacterium norvegicum]CAH0991687.1 o-succinylbenzoate synthase [Sinobacterium norvegicum]